MCNLSGGTQTIRPPRTHRLLAFSSGSELQDPRGPRCRSIPVRLGQRQKPATVSAATTTATPTRKAVALRYARDHYPPHKTRHITSSPAKSTATAIPSKRSVASWRPSVPNHLWHHSQHRLTTESYTWCGSIAPLQPPLVTKATALAGASSSGQESERNSALEARQRDRKARRG